MAHRRLPISLLDQSYSTRLLLTTKEKDCGSSSLLPHDSRQDSSHHSVYLRMVHELNSMSTLDTSFHSPSCSVFPCTHVRAESVYILNKINTHKLDLYTTCRTCNEEVVGSTLGRSRGVETLGKFLTPMCLCSPSSISWHGPKGGDALRLGSKSRYGSCVVGR